MGHRPSCTSFGQEAPRKSANISSQLLGLTHLYWPPATAGGFLGFYATKYLNLAITISGVTASRQGSTLPHHLSKAGSPSGCEIAAPVSNSAIFIRLADCADMICMSTRANLEG